MDFDIGYLLNNWDKNALLEEWILQNSKLDELYPAVVNPIRIITIVKSGKLDFYVAGLTIENFNRVLNATLVYFVCHINMASGVIETPTISGECLMYEVHPKFKTKNIGFQILFGKN